MSISIILQQMGVICILVLIGVYLYNKKIIDGSNSQKLSAIVVDVCNPALILASILSGNITATRSDLITAIYLGAAFYLLLVILGFVIPRVLKSEPANRKFYNLITVYTNTGFLGIPIAKAILPDNAIIYVIVINVFYSLLFYTHGMAVLHSGIDKNTGIKRKNPLLSILNPGTVMAILSLVVFWFDLTPPPIIANTIQYIGNATVFLSMALLGVSIARSSFFKSFKNIKIWFYIVLRMIIVPVAIVLVMKLLSFDNDAILALCLMAAVPAGSLPMIQAEKMGLDTELLSSSIAMTTFISIFSITALMSVISTLL
ncbi:MAG: AEC family transporter [Lachnospiraceae bacterium]|nr:AEC family transporter [Lachnospiraceae bacterium]MBR4816448.1 AEC family transporter [Lachnospiraceae bacterium]